MQAYRDGELALDQLMAFAIAEDHARQEAVYERLSYDCDASTKCEVDRLGEWLQTADELPDHVDARICELEADIERLEGKRQAYDPNDIARG